MSPFINGDEMRKANEYSATFGNADEKEIVKSNLGHIEEEIQEGDEDGTKEAFFAPDPVGHRGGEIKAKGQKTTRRTVTRTL